MESADRANTMRMRRQLSEQRCRVHHDTHATHAQRTPESETSTVDRARVLAPSFRCRMKRSGRGRAAPLLGERLAGHLHDALPRCCAPDMRRGAGSSPVRREDRPCWSGRPDQRRAAGFAARPHCAWRAHVHKGTGRLSMGSAWFADRRGRGVWRCVSRLRRLPTRALATPPAAGVWVPGRRARCGSGV